MVYSVRVGNWEILDKGLGVVFQVLDSILHEQIVTVQEQNFGLPRLLVITNLAVYTSSLAAAAAVGGKWYCII